MQARTSALRALYIVLSYLAAPAALGLLLWRGFRQRGYWSHLEERFGWGAAHCDRDCIWIHAVSVGEVQAAAVLVEALLGRCRDTPIVVTTMSPTGGARARELFGDRVLHSYAPYDIPGAVARFFDRVRPGIAIVLETELWPNLYHECGRRGIPLVLASARISPRSMGRYRIMVGLFRETLSHGIFIAAQSERDAQRFLKLGAPPERTHVVGSLKFDQALPAEGTGLAHRLREECWQGRTVWVAASTHAGEDEVVLEAHRQLLRSDPRAVLLLAPRHPERCDAVAALTKRYELSLVRRSDALPEPETEVYLIDTLGELPGLYGIADLAFVGGSLVPVGGHNLLEPAAAGVATLTGPHNFNADDVVEMLRAAGATEVVSDAAGLIERVGWLAAHPEECRRRGTRGRELVAAHRGAVQRLLDEIAPLLPEPLRAPAEAALSVSEPDS